MNTAILTRLTNQTRPIADLFNFYAFCPIWLKFGMWTTIWQKNNKEWVWDSYGFFFIDYRYPNHCSSHWWWWRQRQSRQREQRPSSISTGLYNFFHMARAAFTGTFLYFVNTKVQQYKRKEDMLPIFKTIRQWQKPYLGPAHMWP